MELSFSGTFGKTLNEYIVTLISRFWIFLSIFFCSFNMDEDLELFSFKLNAISLLNSFLSVRLFFELYVSESATKTICKTFKLALLDIAKLWIIIENLFLGQTCG
jgi:hypothetical protein